MSVHYSSAVWKIKMPNSGRKLVAIALADMANDDGACWPSIRSLQERCNMGETAIRDHLDHLAAIGLIRRNPRFKDNRQTSNLYTFMPLPELEGLKTGGVRNLRGAESDRGEGPESATQNHQKEPCEVPFPPFRNTLSSQIDIYATEPRDL